MESCLYGIEEAIDKNTAAVKELAAVERQRNVLLRELIEVLNNAK